MAQVSASITGDSLMSCVVDMALPRLIEQGKGDPGDITDLLLAAGYTRTMTVNEWVATTARFCRNWRELGLPTGGEPETPQQVMGCFLNEIVDEALNVEGSTAGSVAAAVTVRGFTLGADHD